MLPILEKLAQQGQVIKKAPLAFLLFFVCGGMLGFGASNWYYSKQILDKDGQIYRYRVALGINPASPGALVELTNQELALRAQSIVAKLRQFKWALEEKLKLIDEQQKAGKYDKEQAFHESLKASEQVSQAFDESLASDALNIENELRKRMSPQAMTHVVRVPAFVFEDENGNITGRITFLGLTRAGPFSAGMIAAFADEIEQMAKLLSP